MADNLRVSVKGDLSAAVARFELAGRRAIDAAAVRALNRAATSTRLEASKRIRERYNLKAAAIKKQIRLVRANRNRLAAELVASGRPIPLIEFGARQVRAGVTVAITRQRKLVPHAFIARMPTGHLGVYRRMGRQRLPIKQLFTISLPTAFTRKEIVAAMKTTATARFRIELERELKFRAGV